MGPPRCPVRGPEEPLQFHLCGFPICGAKNPGMGCMEKTFSDEVLLIRAGRVIRGLTPGFLMP